MEGYGCELRIPIDADRFRRRARRPRLSHACPGTNRVPVAKNNAVSRAGRMDRDIPITRNLVYLDCRFELVVSINFKKQFARGWKFCVIEIPIGEKPMRISRN